MRPSRTGNGAWRSLAVAWLVCSLIGGPPAPRPASAGSVPFDVAVFGATPEGIVAAVRAARDGARTVLVDTRERPGGVITHAWLNVLDLSYGPDGKPIHAGIFGEWFSRLGGEAFDLRAAEQAFLDLIRSEPRLTYIPGARAWRARREARSVRGLEVRDASGRPLWLRARVFIDASEDADLAAAASAPWRYGLEEVLGRRVTMASTLIFRMGGVDWAGVARATWSSRDPAAGATARSAWGFLEEMQAYRAADPGLRVRGLNLGRQDDGSVLVNALLIFGVDPLDPESRRRGRERALAELPALVDHIRRHVPGMEAAVLLDAAPELYVRESRHVLTLYRLTIDDVLENRDFADAVAYGSYPVDIQAADADFPGAVPGKPQRYGIPLRSLVPLGLDNLLVVGRSAGYDPLAAGSARTIPTGMATGEAAGAAAALASRSDASLPALAGDPARVEYLRDLLRATGVRLDLPPPEPEPHMAHWAYPALRFLRRYGLASGGYRNDYRLDEPITEAQLWGLLRGFAERSGRSAVAVPPVKPSERVVTVGEAVPWIVEALGGSPVAPAGSPQTAAGAAVALAGQAVTLLGGPPLTSDMPFTRAMAYALVYHLAGPHAVAAPATAPGE